MYLGVCPRNANEDVFWQKKVIFLSDGPSIRPLKERNRHFFLLGGVLQHDERASVALLARCAETCLAPPLMPIPFSFRVRHKTVGK